MGIKQLSKKEIKELNNILETTYGLAYFIDEKYRVVMSDNIIFVDNVPILFLHNQKYFPTLKYPNLSLPAVYVDKGAIVFIIKGADIMRPGITNVDTFNKGDLVLIRDAEFKKNLGLGVALYDADDLEKLDKGKVVLNLTYVNDAIWNAKIK